MSHYNPLHSLQNLCSKSAYRVYHARWMPGRSDINRLRAWALQQRSNFLSLPDQQKAEFVLKTLQKQVAYCRLHLPYYRDILRGFPETFPRDLVEFREMPPLTKSTLRQAGDALISDEYLKDRLRPHATGGSTGSPVMVYMTTEEDGLGDAGNEFFMRQVGGSAGTRMATLYGGDLDVSANPSLNRRIKDWFLNTNNHGCFRLDEAYLMHVHADFEKFQPDVLVGYASAVFLLAKTLQKHHIKPTYPKRAIVTAAEKLEEPHRAVIEDFFDVQVLERYGSRDIGLIGYQRPGSQRIWIDQWDYLVEPESLPDEKGQALLLISRLHTRAMPLLRYQIEDIGVFSSNWRPEQPTQWLEEVKGRTLDWIQLPGGRMVHGSEFPHLFKDYPVLLYQVVQGSDGNVVVSIVPEQDFDDNHRRACEGIVRSNLPGIRVDFEYKQEIIRGAQQKHRPVISHLPPLST